MIRLSRMFALVVTVGAIALPLGAQALAETKDPQAVEVAERLIGAMGGQEAFDQQRVVVFQFQVNRGDEEGRARTHYWNRDDGSYRLELQTAEGQDLLVLFNVNTREGAAWLDGEPVTDEPELSERVESAYGLFINDTYWMLMPWKLMDPGVNLTYEGERTVDGVQCDVVLLTFETGVGLTSNDRYWAVVERESGLLNRWEFVLEDDFGKPGEGDPSVWLWTDWEEVGESGVLISRTKRRPGEGADGVRLVHPMVRMAEEASDGMFDPPPADAGGQVDEGEGRE